MRLPLSPQLAVLATFLASALFGHADTWLGMEGVLPVISGTETREASAITTTWRIDVPSVRLHEERVGNRIFTRIGIPGAGTAGEPFEHSLPVLRQEILLNPGVSFTWAVSVVDERFCKLGDFGLPPEVAPTGRGIPKRPVTDGLLPSLPIASRQTIGTEPAVLLDLGIRNGERVLLLEVYPVQFDPEGGGITHRRKIQVELYRPGIGEEPQAAMAASAAWEPGKRLLIVIDDALVPSLGEYVSEREASGWTIDVLRLSSMGTDPAAIRAHIRARYITPYLRPTHLLLVGDNDTIPTWSGRGAYNPDTDLYYACMDSDGDWVPDMAYGRMPARTTEEVSRMFQRVIQYESEIPTHGAHINVAALATSSDNYQVSEGSQEAVITRHLSPRGYIVERLYSHTHGAGRNQLLSTLNAGCGLITYSGHAYADKWRDPLMEIGDVHALANTGMFPLVLSFACDSGDFSGMEECFAEAWLRTGADVGALAVLAASEDSYWEEDDIFQKCVYSAIYEDSLETLGDIVRRAKQRYLAHYGPGTETLQYFEQYNLLGDPTARFVALDGASLESPVVASRTLPEGCVENGSVLDVEIQVTVSGEAPSGLIIKERIPDGWNLSEATWNGSTFTPTLQDGEYKWLFGVGIPVESGILRYKLGVDGIAGETSGLTGSLVFGDSTEAILGDQTVWFCLENDTDRDGMPDEWETQYGFNLSFPDDAGLDADLDGMSNLEEYLADTHPRDPDSFLGITGISLEAGILSLHWQGGTQSTQYLEQTGSLGPYSTWTVLETFVPPTNRVNSKQVDVSDSATNHFYRIRAAR